MPTNRRYRTRQRTILTLDSFSFGELLAFCSSWHPPTSEVERARSRWATWEDYLSEWLAIREEYRADETFGDPRHGIPFADLILTRWGSGGPPPDVPWPYEVNR